MTQDIEVKATFKKTTIGENGTQMLFELSPRHMNELPELSQMTGSTVYLTVSTEQQQLPIDELDAEYEQQDELPIDDVAEDEVEYDELPMLTDGSVQQEETGE